MASISLSDIITPVGLLGLVMSIALVLAVIAACAALASKRKPLSADMGTATKVAPDAHKVAS